MPWPTDAPDIWGLIKDKVTALVDDKISEQKFEAFAAKLEHVKKAISNYADTTDAEEKGTLLLIVLDTLDEAKIEYGRLGKPQYSLPYLIALGSLHLMALRERSAYGQRFFPDRPKSDREKALKALKDHIASYAKDVDDALTKAREWRRTLFLDGDWNSKTLDRYYHPAGGCGTSPTVGRIKRRSNLTSTRIRTSRCPYTISC